VYLVKIEGLLFGPNRTRGSRGWYTWACQSVWRWFYWDRGRGTRLNDRALKTSRYGGCVLGGRGAYTKGWTAGKQCLQIMMLVILTNLNRGRRCGRWARRCHGRSSHHQLCLPQIRELGCNRNYIPTDEQMTPVTTELCKILLLYPQLWTYVFCWGLEAWGPASCKTAKYGILLGQWVTVCIHSRWKISFRGYLTMDYRFYYSSYVKWPGHRFWNSRFPSPWLLCCKSGSLISRTMWGLRGQKASSSTKLNLPSAS